MAEKADAQTKMIEGEDMTDYNSMDDADFRKMVRDFVEAECPAELRHVSRRMHRHEVWPWTQKLVAKKWIAPGWPASPAPA